MKITFLAHSVDHIGGTIRATMNTASALVDLGHQVEIATVFKRRDTPLFPVDPRITVTPLVDKSSRARKPAAVTSLSDRVLARVKSRVYPAGDTRVKDFSALTDKRVARFLAGCDADVIVGTRPGLNVYIAQYAPRRAVTVAQEHLFFDHHKPQLRDAMSRHYRRVDALVTVSEADADNYRAHMPHLAAKTSFIPNSIVPTPLATSTQDSKLIVAAGRIENPKRFDMLLEAFTEVHRRHPDWKLRIYGYGKRLGKLRKIIEKRGIGNAVSLMGQRTPLDPEWVKGSIAAVTSKYESFGMTLAEAMNCGLPVVSTACHYGPPEIVHDGVDGLLTPVDDTAAVTEALCRLIEDPQLRHRMSAAAIESSRRYFPETVGASYVQLFEELLRQRERTPSHGLPLPVNQWRGMTPVAASAGGVGGFAPTRQAVADCVSDSFDTVRLALPGLASGAGLALVADGMAPVQVPSSRVGDGVEATLDAALSAQLAEGRWTLSLRGEPVKAGRIDSRQLLRPLLNTPSTVMVPYADEEALTFRVWRRDDYAEVDSVDWDGTSIRVGGQLWGGPAPANVMLTAKRRKDGHVLRFPAHLSGTGRFGAAIDAPGLAAIRSSAQDLWDLWLNDVDEVRPAVRLGRFFDDIADRKPTQRFAAGEYGAPRTGRVRPYYTVDNELSIGVVDPKE